MNDRAFPDFESRAFLHAHIDSILPSMRLMFWIQKADFSIIFWMMARSMTGRPDTSSAQRGSCSITAMPFCNPRTLSIVTGWRMAWHFFRIIICSRLAIMCGN